MPRRPLLALVVVLYLGLSLPALAKPGEGNGNGNGQGGGPPTTATTPAVAPPTTVTAPSDGQGNGQGNGNGNGQGNGNANANGQGNGNANGQGNGNANANGQGNGNANANGQGNGRNNVRPDLAPSLPTNQSAAARAATANDSATAIAGRIAFFVAPMRVSQEVDSSLPGDVGAAQSAPDRMISWLLSPDQQRFLPVISSPLVALVVVGRALASAGSGAVAPIALLVALAVTKLFDGRRVQATVAIPA